MKIIEVKEMSRLFIFIVTYCSLGALFLLQIQIYYLFYKYFFVDNCFLNKINLFIIISNTEIKYHIAPPTIFYKTLVTSNNLASISKFSSSSPSPPYPPYPPCPSNPLSLSWTPLLLSSSPSFNCILFFTIYQYFYITKYMSFSITVNILHSTIVTESHFFPQCFLNYP